MKDVLSAAGKGAGVVGEWVKVGADEYDGRMVGKAKYIVFEGIVGCGKTTQSRNLGIDRVLKINKEAVGGIWPDLVIWIDTDLDIALARTRDASGDKFESMDKKFFEKVRKGYLEEMKKFPKLVKKVDGNGVIDVVEKRVWKVVQQL